MKYILSAALLLSVMASANAQHQVKVVRAAYVPANETSNMQMVLDRLQQESQNTVVYPLVAMTKAALTRVQDLKKTKKERIRTNNGKPKRTVNPNRA